MSREWRFFLDDMILCCEKITTFVGTSTLDEFLEDALVYDAVWNAIKVEVPLLLRTLQAFKQGNPP